jgi:hypothetical protein
MWNRLRELDRLLRGEATAQSALKQGTIEVHVGGLAGVIAALGVVYGVCMAAYALFRTEGPSYLQVAASALKVPALFFLTLVVTFPSLYVFNALVGSRLTILAVLRLLIASLGVTLAVLASLGPIVAFFSVSTTSYGFMVLLNVAIFAVSGVLGLVFLLQTLNRLSNVETVPSATAPSAADSTEQAAKEPGAPAPQALGPLDPVEGHVLARHVKSVFRCWVILFGLVGAQMSWVLRPFVGNPDQPFAWFRARESNFFEAVWSVVQSLVS